MLSSFKIYFNTGCQFFLPIQFHAIYYMKKFEDTKGVPYPQDVKRRREDNTMTERTMLYKPIQPSID